MARTVSFMLNAEIYRALVVRAPSRVAIIGDKSRGFVRDTSGGGRKTVRAVRLSGGGRDSSRRGLSGANHNALLFQCPSLLPHLHLFGRIVYAGVFRGRRRYCEENTHRGWKTWRLVA